MAKSKLTALQGGPSSFQELANVMFIQIHNQKNGDFPIDISGSNVIALYDTGANVIYISYACYMKLNDSPLLKFICAMSVHSATGHNLCPM